MLDTLKLDASKGLQHSLLEQITQGICDGRLPPGTRLPPSRKLARQLGVSRNTVVQVFEQLKSEGYLKSRIGSGMFVSDEIPGPPVAPPSMEAPIPVAGPVESQRLRQLAELTSTRPALVRTETASARPFTLGLPDLEAFPFKLWGALLHRHGQRARLASYDHPMGFPPLREAIAHYLTTSRGVLCTPDQVLVTQGAQQALFLCAWVLLNPEDGVLIENPGYRRARSVFLNATARLEPVPVTRDGISVSYLESLARSQVEKVKLLYTTPSHQYPMGGILPAGDRLRLLQWAARHQVWMIEDDYDSEYHFTHKPVAAIQGLYRNTPVIYIGSFSKTLLPSLRLGYMVLPDHLVEPFAHAKSLVTGDASLLLQAVVAEFLTEGHFARHIRRMRQNYHEKWQHFTGLIDGELPTGSLIGRDAGMHLVVRTPDQDDEAIIRALQKQGFGGAPLSSYYLDRARASHGLVLGFAFSRAAQRQELVEVLRGILQ